MPPDSLNLESQLFAIMDVLVRAAVTEISQLFSESSATLLLQITQSQKENETLKTRMKLMRTELFTLRLQTRTRPTGRFTPTRGTVSRPRARAQVVIRPRALQESVEEAASVTLPSNGKKSSSANQVGVNKLANVDTPDVILIKDEDDVGGCGTVEGQEHIENPRKQGDVDAGNLESCMAGNQELRIMSVHGRGEGPLQELSDGLFAISELQAFSSLSPDHNVNDSLLNYTAGANERASMSGMQDISVGLVRSSPLERHHATKMPSTSLIPAMETPVVGADGHPSHVSQFPQQQNIYPHTVIKSMDSNYCDKSFLSHDDLIVHRATHTKETATSCSFCGKSFINKTTLTIHMRIHTGEKPFACTLCGKRFTQNGSLKIHLRTHSGEKPYSCNQCNASFNNPSNLRRHMITHTNAHGVV